DLTAAAEVLGLDADALRAQMRGGSAAGGNGARAETAGRATPADAGVGAAGTPVANGSADADECRALFEKMRSGGGPQALTDAERTQLRACRGQMDGPAARGSGDERTGFVFVTANGQLEARRVVLGVNDW